MAQGIPGMQQAQAALDSLNATMRRWQQVAAIKATLPTKYAARIPRSRLGPVRNILRFLVSKGAVRTIPGTAGLGWVQLAIGAGAVVLVASAVAAAVVAKQIPRIQGEARASRAALATARQVQQLWSIEQAEAQKYGIEKAAGLRQQRETGAAALWDAPADATPAEGEAWQLPWWVLPVGIGLGAVALVSAQKGTPYIRRRYGL